MDKRPRKELIEGLRDSLRDFEERYDRSEWENFQQQRNKTRRKRVPLFVKLAGIAASLFLVVYGSVRILPLLDHAENDRKHEPTAVPHQSKPDSLNVDSLASVHEAIVREREGSEPTVRSDQSEVKEWGRPKAGVRSAVKWQHQKQRVEHIQRIEQHAPVAKPSTVSQQPIGDNSLPTVRLSPEGDRHPGQSRERSGKRLRVNLPEMDGININWPKISGIKMGANVTPAFTNKGFSLGGGVSARLPLAKRLSMEVGVSYLNIKVGQDKEADPTDTVSLQRVGMRKSLGMVALPVSLNYTISESFSASLGLSPFRVVQGRHTDNLLRYRWAHSGATSGDSTGGRLVHERSRIQRPDSVYTGNTYIGFIQLSGQYSPLILQRRNLVLAPYVAIPLGQLRTDRYRWLHGGVSIRWYFGKWESEKVTW